MEKEFEYTVYEYKGRGTRFFSSYDPNGETDKLKIVGHCHTVEDAQALCKVTEAANMKAFFDSISPFLKTLDDFEDQDIE